MRSNSTGVTLHDLIFIFLAIYLTFWYMLVSTLVMLDDKHEFLSMDELVARESLRRRLGEALRYAAIHQASPARRPLLATVAAILRSLADRIEPAPKRGSLAHR